MSPIVQSETTLRVIMIASGQRFQHAAAWAAPTYVRCLRDPACVSVLLPEREEVIGLLRTRSEQFKFGVKTFPFAPESNANIVTQLKLQAFWHVTSQAEDNELLLFVDADTYCCKPLDFEESIVAAILSGSIGVVLDIEDRHCNNRKKPWYVPLEERAPYINSGVLLVSRHALNIFAVLLETSKDARFNRTPYWDQTILNFALSKFYKDKLLFLNADYNRIRCHSPTKIIGHCAGASKGKHVQLCTEILRERLPDNEYWSAIPNSADVGAQEKSSIRFS